MITQNEGGIVIDLGNMLVVGPNWAAIQALNKAHADALADIHQVGFDAKHQQGWTYASFDAIANVLRPVLAKHELSIAPTMDDAQVKENGQNKYGSTEWLATARISMALMHSSGAMRVSKHQGQGSDYSDKAINKAWTVAAKYALMRLFLISTGEKDENDADDDNGKKVDPPKQAQPKADAPKAEPPKVTVVTPTGGNSDKQGKLARPLAPETLKAAIATRVTKAGNLAADEGQRGALVGALNALFASDAKEIQTNKRHMILQYLVGKDSSKALTGAEIAALLPWASERLDSGEYAPDKSAAQEAALIIAAMDADAGQAALI
jgi:hypothetical protein